MNTMLHNQREKTYSSSDSSSSSDSEESEENVEDSSDSIVQDVLLDEDDFSESYYRKLESQKLHNKSKKAKGK